MRHPDSPSALPPSSSAGTAGSQVKLKLCVLASDNISMLLQGPRSPLHDLLLHHRRCYTFKHPFNGVPVRGLIDTGTTSVVHPSIWQNFVSLTTAPLVSCELNTATGEQVQVHNSAKIALSVGDFHTILPMVVASIKDDCTLGVDSLRSQQCILDFGSSVFCLGPMFLPLHATPTKASDAAYSHFKNA